MLGFLILIGIIIVPFLMKNKNLKENTRTTCMITYGVIIVLYLIFGVWLG